MNKTDTLRPVSAGDRLFGGVSYVLMWWSSLIVIQAFVLGQGFLPPIGQLNLVQASVVLIVAAALFVIMFSLNGAAGMRYGIPYSVQTRTSFGLRGSSVVELLRALPAIVWYGIGTWIAALSLDGIIAMLTDTSWPVAKYLYFVALIGVQTLLGTRGIRTMKWFNAVSSLVIASIMGYMFAHIIGSYDLEIRDSWTAEGTWGQPFWISLTAAVGVLATVMLNISDMTRHLQVSTSRLWLGHLFGVAPPWFFMLGLGIVAGASLGIWDPVQALIQLSPHPAAALVLLAFIVLAQFTTNLTINILPPALVFMDIFRMSWRSGVVLTGALALISFPWVLLGNAESFFGFILYYSALFGPILGVMLADYYVVRRRRLDVESLYDQGPAATCWYSGGLNLAGLLAVAIPATITMIWALPLSWLIGVPSGFLLYLAGYRALYGKG